MFTRLPKNKRPRSLRIAEILKHCEAFPSLRCTIINGLYKVRLQHTGSHLDAVKEKMISHRFRSDVDMWSSFLRLSGIIAAQETTLRRRQELLVNQREVAPRVMSDRTIASEAYRSALLQASYADVRFLELTEPFIRVGVTASLISEILQSPTLARYPVLVVHEHELTQFAAWLITETRQLDVIFQYKCTIAYKTDQISIELRRAEALALLRFREVESNLDHIVNCEEYQWLAYKNKTRPGRVNHPEISWNPLNSQLEKSEYKKTKEACVRLRSLRRLYRTVLTNRILMRYPEAVEYTALDIQYMEILKRIRQFCNHIFARFKSESREKNGRKIQAVVRAIGHCHTEIHETIKQLLPLLALRLKRRTHHKIHMLRPQIQAYVQRSYKIWDEDWEYLITNERISQENLDRMNRRSGIKISSRASHNTAYDPRQKDLSTTSQTKLRSLPRAGHSTTKTQKDLKEQQQKQQQEEEFPPWMPYF